MAVQASWHQGQNHFKGKGQQCLANSAAAIRYSNATVPSEWNRSDLDQILIAGDELYVDITEKTQTQFLTTDDLPLYIGQITESFHGTLCGDTAAPFFSLEDGLQQVTAMKSCGCIFTMGNTTPSYSSAIIKYNETFYFFDPHSRSDTGMITVDGFATLTIHKNISALSLFIRHLAASLKLKGQVPYEVSCLTIHDNYASSNSESEFSGFEEMSDGEYACRLYMIEHLEVSDTSDISDISSISDTIGSPERNDSMISETINEALKDLDESDLYLDAIDTETFDKFHESYENINSLLDDSNNDIDNTQVKDDGSKKITVADTDKSEVDGKTLSEVSDNSYVSEHFRRDERTVGEASENAENVTALSNNNINGVCDVGESENVNECLNDTHNISDAENVNNSMVDESCAQVEGNSFIGEQSLDQERYETSRSRKRIRNENSWKRNILKRKRNSGESYITISGNAKRAKILKAGCGLNCKKKCHSKISEEQRKNIFHEFWGSGSYLKQRHFLNYTVREKARKRISNNQNPIKNRKVSREYSFKMGTESIQVCKKFYMDTLDICNSKLDVALGHRSPLTGVTGDDKRGKHANRSNKIPNAVVLDVKDHINSFPRVESHYCRQNTNKEYLEPDLNLSKMYSMYVKQCEANNFVPAKESMYRYIFNTQFNIAFNKPLKDQCDMCTEYKNKTDVEKSDMLQIYSRHEKNKELARQSKESDKKIAKSNATHCTACFDLQQVITLPKAHQSCLYYSRKLNNYNFTLYSLSTGDAFCYLWNQTDANRGSCEIASCVFSFYKTIFKDGIKTITTYSDNCSGQNRNRYFVSMMWYSLKLLDFETVSHKFLERGHTQNENDSVHSCIEKSVKNISIFTTPQLATTIQMARRAQPYKVYEMTYEDFFDFKSLSDRIRNLDVDTEGCKVRWMEIRTITFCNDHPDTAKLQYDYDGPVRYVNLQPNLRKHLTAPQLKKLFNPDTRPTLDQAKYNDLKKLCERNIIPRSYHSFYESLPVSNGDD